MPSDASVNRVKHGCIGQGVVGLTLVPACGALARLSGVQHLQTQHLTRIGIHGEQGTWRIFVELPTGHGDGPVIVRSDPLEITPIVHDAACGLRPSQASAARSVAQLHAECFCPFVNRVLRGLDNEGLAGHPWRKGQCQCLCSEIARARGIV